MDFGPSFMHNVSSFFIYILTFVYADFPLLIKATHFQEGSP